MEMSSTRPAIKIHRILFRDYATFMWLLFTIFAVGIFVFAIVGVVTGGAGDEEAITGAISTIIFVCIPGFAFWNRFNMLKNVLEQGPITEGVVAQVRGIGSQRRVFYAYKVNGKAHVTRNVIIIGGFRSPERKGNIVQVAHDPEKPSRAFIVSLYS